MHFKRKDTDYGAYRELLKDGKRVRGWVEQLTPEGSEAYGGDFYYAYGCPSKVERTADIYICKTLEQARKEIIENLL